MTNEDIGQLVSAYLYWSVQHGYMMHSLPTEVVVSDLRRFVPELRDVPTLTLTKYIREWRELYATEQSLERAAFRRLNAYEAKVQRWRRIFLFLLLVLFLVLGSIVLPR